MTGIASAGRWRVHKGLLVSAGGRDSAKIRIAARRLGNKSRGWKACALVFCHLGSLLDADGRHDVLRLSWGHVLRIMLELLVGVVVLRWLRYLAVQSRVVEVG